MWTGKCSLVKGVTKQPLLLLSSMLSREKQATPRFLRAAGLVMTMRNYTWYLLPAGAGRCSPVTKVTWLQFVGEKRDLYLRPRSAMIVDRSMPFCCSQNAFLLQVPHLSKGPSDLERNGTQEKTPFSAPVFHGLSCGVDF